MKIFLLSALLSFTAYGATDISIFKGQTYKKADYSLCLNDYDTITKNMSSLKDFTVLDGGCLGNGPENFSLEFDYIHPLANAIKDYSVTLADQASCLKAVTAAQQDLLASGNHFVDSFCEGNELTTHFINTTQSVVRSLNKLGKYQTQSECLNFIDELTDKSKIHKMTTFMSYCQETKFDFSGKSYFTPVFNYISHFDIEMGVINGKTSGCLEYRDDLEKNFTSHNVTLVHVYCTGVMGPEQKLQETILYLKPQLNLYITEYEGSPLSTQEACEVKMNAVMIGLENAGMGVLYGHCKQVGPKYFKSSITYLKSI